MNTHVVDDGKTASNNHIQNTAELRSPEAEGVTRAGDLTQAKFRTKSTSEAGAKSAHASSNDTGCDSLPERKAKFGGEDAQRNDANVDVKRPPHQEYLFTS